MVDLVYQARTLFVTPLLVSLLPALLQFDGDSGIVGMNIAKNVPLADGLRILPAFFILPGLDHDRVHQIAPLADQLELLRKLRFMGITLARFPHDIDSPVEVALGL